MLNLWKFLGNPADGYSFLPKFISDNEILTNHLQGTKIKCHKVSRVLFFEFKVIINENSAEDKIHPHI